MDIKIIEQKVDAWSTAWKVPLYVEARQELIELIKEISDK